ncbi:MAG: hypothetical protein ABIG39_03125, partial [Candidatus Micrarchaeota archaeon]
WSIHVESQYVVNKGPEAMTEVASGEFDTGKYVKDGKVSAVVGGTFYGGPGPFRKSKYSGKGRCAGFVLE